MDLKSFYRGKRILVTGHTGFKGSWLCRMLTGFGADVTGFALNPPTHPNLFDRAGLSGRMTDIRGSVCDFAALSAAFAMARPEIVIHLAAQPIVRESYRVPRETFETNVMGTVNLLECVRLDGGVKSLLNVTTDKVYLNREDGVPCREDDPLDGYDPYSNSKSCSELVTHSYAASFFRDVCPVSTARAGNVIGGGDWAADRIVPDCVRAALQGKPVEVRNPSSVRPYQHVLEPLCAYLLIAMRQWEDPALAGWYNVGPGAEGCASTGELADLFGAAWGEGFARVSPPQSGSAPHEAAFLRLDCEKIARTLGWKPVWDIRRAVAETCAFTRVWQADGDIPAEMDREIDTYLKEAAQ